MNFSEFMRIRSNCVCIWAARRIFLVGGLAHGGLWITNYSVFQGIGVGSCIVSNWVRGARWVYSWVYYGGSGVAYGVGLGTWRTGAYFVGVQTDDVV